MNEIFVVSMSSDDQEREAVVGVFSSEKEATDVAKSIPEYFSKIAGVVGEQVEKGTPDSLIARYLSKINAHVFFHYEGVAVRSYTLGELNPDFFPQGILQELAPFDEDKGGEEAEIIEEE